VSRRLPLMGIIAAALCVPVTAAVVLLVFRQQADRHVQSARHDALLAASHIVRDVLSYDYRTVDQDVARARAETTGVFAKQYAATVPQFRAAARQTRTIVLARPHASGVISASRHDVVLLMFVDQASVKQPRGSATPDYRRDQSRVRVTLTRVGDRWLMSQLATV